MTLTIASMVALASDGDQKPLAVTNKNCPVMKSSVSEKFRSEYKGQFVYFCCQGCVTMFEKDPETYIAKLSKEDQEAIKPNDICPVTKEAIHDRTRWIENEGRKIYFCCEGCMNMYKAKLSEKKTD
jgi:YHS domain-containing protein